MDYSIDEWKSLLKEFSSSIEKSADEVRECRDLVLQMKDNYIDSRSSGRIIRDDRRLVISAPEIIIGNVDKEGNLLGESLVSTIVVKGNTVSIQGVANTSDPDDFGTVETRAAVIRNIAEDAGPDGKEHYVRNTSSIVNQAHSIALSSDSDRGVFTSAAGASEGINITSDSSINISASKSFKGKKKVIEDRVTSLKEQKTGMKESVDGLKKTLDANLENLAKIMKTYAGMGADDDDVRTSVPDLNDLRIDLETETSTFVSTLNLYVDQVSLLAEVCRQIAALDDIKAAIEEPGENDSTGCSVHINAENTSITTNDGDGITRTNSDSGFTVNAAHIQMDSFCSGGKAKDGYFYLDTSDVLINTSDIETPDDSTVKRAAAGKVAILSKELNVSSVDLETKDDKQSETALAKDGAIRMRAEKLELSSVGTDGKAAGSFSVNAKEIALKSMDVTKEEGKEDTEANLAEGGSILVEADAVNVGNKDKKFRTKNVKIAAENSAMFADTTLEVQQGEGKAILQLDGGNANLAGGETAIYGNTTVNANAEVKGELKTPKATIDNVEAKSSFKSTNISDGIPVPPSPASGSLSAKLKEE